MAKNKNILIPKITLNVKHVIKCPDTNAKALQDVILGELNSGTISWIYCMPRYR